MADSETKAQLTKRSISAFRPSEGQAQRDVYDSVCRGLVLRIGKKRKTWLYRYRVPGQKHAQVFTLGAYSEELDVKAARKLAALKRGEGGDPAEEHRRLSTAETVKELGELYLERHARERKKASSAREDKKMLNRDVYPAFGDHKVAEIKRAHVIALLDVIVARGAKVKANRVRSLLSKLWNFAIERSIAESNPVQGVPRQVQERPRERCLSDAEIAKLWKELESFKSQKIADAYRLMLLTAQRVGEVLHLAWGELDLDGGWWVIPAERSKTHQMHRVPLTATALEILKRRKAEAGDCPFVFSGGRVSKPLRYIGKRHAEVVEACGFAFQPRDLRRTAGTWVASTGVGRFVVARLLGHADRAITSVYDKYSYDSEKRAALMRWDARLQEIVTGRKPSNVIEFPSVAAATSYN